ncbi:hypothetical protein ACQPXS_43955 [Streptomyces sp. CA-142005]|uniref:hypothetical protein n=1 Tax=Streptomyces sp. CA-142005 TaxID=3240052 RepID=UPI003D8AEAF5
MNETHAHLARRLLTADADGWTETGTQALLAALGREGRLRAVGRFEEPYVNGEAYVELAVPVLRPADTAAAAQAAAFRAVSEELTAELGEASIMGVYGDLGPFYASGPAWGTPYLRWRGRPNTLELRAGADGPELVLQPTGPLENWFWRQGHGEEHAISGFFGSRNDPANIGLGHPGGWRARSWEAVTHSLADFLATLPAETTALGRPIGMPVYGRGAGPGAPLLFEISCDDRLVIGCFPPHDMDPRPEALGWGRMADHPATREVWDDDQDPRWRVDAGGPGQPRGHELAEMLVATARAAGVRQPEDLVIGGEAEYMGPYHVTFYGLGLPTG